MSEGQELKHDAALDDYTLSGLISELCSLYGEQSVSEGWIQAAERLMETAVEEFRTVQNEAAFHTRELSQDLDKEGKKRREYVHESRALYRQSLWREIERRIDMLSPAGVDAMEFTAADTWAFFERMKPKTGRLSMAEREEA